MSDSLAPDVGQEVAPDGTVTYEFAGRVLASGGVDIDAADNNTPPDTDKVRWLRQPDGAVVAELAAYEAMVSTRGGPVVKTRTVWLKAIDDDPTVSGAQVHVVAEGQNDHSATLETSAGATASSIVAVADTHAATILDDTGDSDFTRPADLAPYALTSDLPAAHVSSADSATNADTAGQLDASNATEAHNLTVSWNDPVISFFIDGLEVLDIDCSPFPRSI